MGPADTDLKVWDLSRRFCVSTVTGHRGTVEAIGKYSAHRDQKCKCKQRTMRSAGTCHALDLGSRCSASAAQWCQVVAPPRPAVCRITDCREKYNQVSEGLGAKVPSWECESKKGVTCSIIPKGKDST